MLVVFPREPNASENLEAILREVHAGVPYECLCHARCLKAVSIVSTKALRRSQGDRLAHLELEAHVGQQVFYRLK